jgi:hypothetical protein
MTHAAIQAAMDSRVPLTVELLKATEDECVELFAFLAPFHARYGLVPLDPVKAMASIWETAKDSTVYVARDEHGKLVGTIALFVDEVWYSRAPIMWNRWLCIAEDTREGEAIRLLLKRAKEAADTVGAILVIERSNYKRASLRGDFGRVADLVGYAPVGHLTRHR